MTEQLRLGLDIFLAAVALIAFLSRYRYKVDKNEEDERSNRATVKEFRNEYSAFTTAMNGFTREQVLINKFTGDNLADINRKMERIEIIVSERTGLVELVRELLKRLDKINIE